MKDTKDNTSGTKHELKDKLIEAVESEIDKLEDINEFTGRVPRVSFFFAVLVIGLLLSILSENLTIGPSWGILALVSVLLVPLLIAIFIDHHRYTRLIALTITTILTVGLITSVLFLVYSLFEHPETAIQLFRNAIILWSANVVVFAIWYWELDAGGPLRRHTNKPGAPDLMFPQMTSSSKHWSKWKPSFSDYVFVAFNASTAFSPTDTLVMSKRAKVLMMTQASISLVTVAVIAARAINIA